MAEKKLKIFMIAGEESGDNLGSKLMKSLKNKYKGEVEFIGIGGSKMAYEGLFTIFPMQEINLMGFMEILPHAFKLIKRINQTTQRIISEKPDILITIDSPGFNFRVVKKLKQQNIDIKKLHYVAPSVWAYKPERAKKCAALFDKLLCILPWEPPYFKKENLNAPFIGHPVFEDLVFLNDSEKSELKAKYKFKPADKIIAILPGSRMGEIKRLLPIFAEAANKIHYKSSNTKFILMPTENLREEAARLDHLIPDCILVSDGEEKRKLLQICNAAIVKSGTVSLEVAALSCPAVTCYKVNEISHWLIRRMLNIDFANLVNISAEKEIIRELIQEDCNAEEISKEILKIINSELVTTGQLEDTKFELQAMGLGATEKPSDKAADEVLLMLK